MKFYTTARISENMYTTPEGYLVCVGVPIARTGDMIYGAKEVPIEAGPDGKIVVSRDARDVFDPKTMASFDGKSVTIQHPTEFVGPLNWSTLTKGTLQNIRRGQGEFNNDLLADLLITDAIAIQKVRDGLREVSCGYDAEYIATGIGRGVQRNIIGNHLALVDEGRAGASYAIRDHKGKGSKMKLGDRMKKIFGKAIDEAIEAEGTEETTDEGEGTLTNDSVLKAVAALTKKIDALTVPKKGKTADLLTPENTASGTPAVAKDEPGAGTAGVAMSMDERMTALEKKFNDFVASQLESEDEEAEEPPKKKKKDDGESEDDFEGEETEGEEAEDADSDEDEDETEDGYEEGSVIGDAADTESRVEILAPGMDAKIKDVKKKALVAFSQTKDGKALLGQFTGGKKLDLKDPNMVNTLFVSASEILKSKRTSALARTKTKDFGSFDDAPKGAMTPEELNKKNEEHWAKKAAH